MKKPKIRFIPYEGFAVKKSSGEYLDDDVTAEAYEEMIDALIDLTKEYKELVDSGDCGFWDPENVDAFQKAKQALKKAGVE